MSSIFVFTVFISAVVLFQRGQCGAIKLRCVFTPRHFVKHTVIHRGSGQQRAFGIDLHFADAVARQSESLIWADSTVGVEVPTM